MPNNKILTAANAALAVTNLAASGSGGTQTMEGVPIGTSDGTATGELVVKVKLVGTVPPPSGSSYTPTFRNATASGTIPAGVLGWSVTAISGTIEVLGEALPVGATVTSGGYTGYVTDDAVDYDVTAGVALVVFDAPA